MVRKRRHLIFPGHIKFLFNLLNIAGDSHGRALSGGEEFDWNADKQKSRPNQKGGSKYRSGQLTNTVSALDQAGWFVNGSGG